jgi:integrase
MAYAGAAGTTASEMATTLHFALPPAQLNAAFDACDLPLASRGQGAQGTDGGPMRLDLVNAAWAEKTYPFSSSYLDILAQYYGAGINLLDFINAYLALPEPYNLIFILGEQTGCRVGEVLGMHWRDIDLPGRKIHVRQQMQDGRLCVLKDKESRIVPLATSLAPVLEAWKLKTGGVGQLFAPANLRHGGRPDIGRPAQFIRPITVHKALAKALAACELPKMTLYQCTRHTFASQWVMNGGSMEELAKILGHSSTSTTQHYAHLAPDYFGPRAFDMVAVDLSKPAAVVLSLRDVSGQLRQRIGRTHQDSAEQQLA